MKKDGAFKLLEVGRQTKLYPVKAVQTGHITKESTYSLHCFFDQNGEIGFKAQSALSEPEYRTDERLRRELTKQDINDLRAKKTLNRLMQHDGEYCFVGFNKDTQRMIYVPCKDVRIPDYIFGQFIGPSRKQEFERGGSVLLENCNYSGNDNHFSGHAHFDVHRRDYVVDDPHYERPYLPEHIRTQMPKEEVDKYFAGEVMKGHSPKISDLTLRPMPASSSTIRNRQQAYSRLRRRDRSVILPNRWSRRKPPIWRLTSPKKDRTGVRAQGCKPKPVTAGEFFKA